MGEKHRRKNLTVSILSLSLLTVMAGAAVAPALGIIKAHFADVNQLLVQMIISMPALFIVLTNLIFPKLTAKYTSRSLLLFGLLLYTAGGSLAGMFDNIYIVLIFRALVGVGVGIIMPMSTGLLSFYYTRDKQDKLMGYSSAMNQMGGAVATLLSGMLASISWRLSFLVYLMGLISIVLCLLFLPNERIGDRNADASTKQNTNVGNNPTANIKTNADNTVSEQSSAFKQYFPFIFAMFLLMVTFFVFPCEFALETAKEGVIPQKYISVIMASMDIVAFVGGLSFVLVKKYAGSKTRIVAPLMFVIGYAALAFVGGWFGAILGSIFIGFANGLGIPFIISTASKKAGKSAASTVMPLLSAALYLAQFLTPMLLSVGSAAFSALHAAHPPYCIALLFAVLLTLWSLAAIRENEPEKHAVRQEN